MEAATSNKMKIVTVLLSAVAAGLAGLLLYQSQTQDALPGCDGGSGCAGVLASKWSLWFGIPVSLLALGNYTGMFAAALSYDPKDKKPQLSVTLTLAVTAVAAIAAAAWFISVQVVALGSFCKYCMGTHAVGVAAGALSLWMVVPRVPTKPLGAAAGAGLVLIGVMIVGQVMGEAPPAPDAVVTFAEDPPPLPEPDMTGTLTIDPFTPEPRVSEPLPTPRDPRPTPEPSDPTPTPTPSTTTPTPSDPAADTPSVETSIPKTPRLVKLNGGKLEFDIADLPLIGDPDAPMILAVMYDYRCSHCRDTRLMLERTKRKYGNKLAIICLPTPLSNKCNRLIRQYNPNNRYSCDLAKVSLAMWKVDPDKWAELDRLLYASEEHHTPARSQIAAGKLVKEKNLTRQLRDDWVGERVKKNVNLYAAAGRSTGNTTLPMLITTHGIMTGTPRHPLDIDDLINGRRR